MPLEGYVSAGELVLDLRGVGVSYSDVSGRMNPVLHDVSLQLKRGQIVGLAGESGCGKTTTALVALGYRAKSAHVTGQVMRPDGSDILGLPVAKLRKLWGKSLAYLPQDAATALNPALTIGTQLSQPLRRHLRLRGDALMKRKLELLEQVRVPEPRLALDRYPHQFSGGQQQRIALAIAMSCRPDVLVLDEPTSGLDVTTRLRVIEVLRQIINETGVATLFVSHDMALLYDVADELAVMYAGQIVEAGLSADVCASPGHPYTRALLAAVPSAQHPHSLRGIPGRPPSSIVVYGCAFADRCSFAVPACREGSIGLERYRVGRLVRCIRVADVAAQPIVADEPRRVGAVGAPLFDLVDVRSRYPGATVDAVAGASFVIDVGQIFGIVGESGSGKSTLLRAIAGLHPPYAGSMTFRGTMLPSDLSARPRELLRDIQLVFQNPDSSLNPRHTVAKLLARPLGLYRPDLGKQAQRREAVALLEEVKLPAALLDRYPGELSGGQKQRVALARAFAAQPSLLLCDEVTSALDVSVQASVVDLIAELADTRGTAVVFVSHDVGVVRAIVSEVAVMQDGVIRELGQVDAVFDRPEDDYTRELLAAVPELTPVSSVSRR